MRNGAEEKVHCTEPTLADDSREPKTRPKIASSPILHRTAACPLAAVAALGMKKTLSVPCFPRNNFTFSIHATLSNSRERVETSSATGVLLHNPRGREECLPRVLQAETPQLSSRAEKEGKGGDTTPSPTGVSAHLRCGVVEGEAERRNNLPGYWQWIELFVGTMSWA